MPGLTNAMVTGGNYFAKDVEAITPAVHSAAAPTKVEFDALVDKFNDLLAQLKSNVNAQV